MSEGRSEEHRESGGERVKRPGAIGLISTIVVALVAIAGVAVFFTSLTYKSPSGTEVATSLGMTTVNGKTMPHVALAFQTYPDSSGQLANGVAIHPGGNSGWPAYGPTNDFQIPAHALVTVTVRQYDSGGQLNNNYFAKVIGTVGGVARFNGKIRSSVDPTNVGHTFTVRALPGVDNNFFVNVPLPAVGGNNQADNGQYNTIVFSFISGNPGTYAWNCEFPCGLMVASFGAVMGSYGYMSGFVHVV